MEVLWGLCKPVLCARKDLESSFHRCVAPVKLVQACLSAGTVWHRRFNRRGGAEMHVQASLSAWKDLESTFHHCWSLVRLVQTCLCVWNVWHSHFNHSVGPVKLVQACLCAWKYLESSFHHCWGTVRLMQACFMCQERSRLQFLPLCKSCNARTSLFKCGKGVISPS